MVARSRSRRYWLHALLLLLTMLTTLVVGAPRIDLDGQPVGTVTAKDEQAAKDKLAARQKPKPAAGRLTLADLKAATKQRKARA